MTKVLVTGHNGLLGGACVKALARHGYEIVHPEGEDLRNPQVVYWLFNRHHPDAVIHCAAKVGGVKANRDSPVDFIEDNISINSNVIRASHAFGVKKLINIGTSCLYPKDAPVPVKESSLLTGPFEPDVEAYAAAKLLAYETCNAYRRQHGDNFVTVCPCNLYGDNDNYGPSAHVIPALITKAASLAKSGEPLEVWGDGTAIREFLHASDAAEAIIAVLEKYNSPDLINIGSGISTTISELAYAIIEVWGLSGAKWSPGEPTGIQQKTFDVTKIKSLGWEPQIDLMAGIFMVSDDFVTRKSKGILRTK